MKGFSFKKLLLILFGVLIIGTLAYIGICNISYSEGTRAGYLIKVSKKGYLFKTYEGEVNLGGIGSGDINAIVSNNIWEFSVTDEEVYKKMLDLQGKHVTLTYSQRLRGLPWQGDTDYFISAVKEVK